MERRLEHERPTLYRDLPFLHRLQQCSLGLRWRAVDLVGEKEPGEQRAVTEDEVARSLIEHERAGEIGWQQVGRELCAFEVEPERLSERPSGERLAEAGEVLEKDVTAGENAGEHQRERIPLADDRDLDLVEYGTGQPGGI